MSVQIVENLIPKNICYGLVEKSKSLLKSENMVMRNFDEKRPPLIKKSTQEVIYRDFEKEGIQKDFGKKFVPDEYVNLIRPNYEEYHGKFDPVSLKEDELDCYFENDRVWIDKAIGSSLALITEKMTSFYKVKIVPDQAGLVKMKTGAHNGLHYDQRNPFTEEAREKLGPDKQPKLSEYSFLAYLNTCDKDYTGGELYFPKYDLLIKPKRGMVVFFIGDPDHEHEVLKVTSGERYSLLGFSSEEGKPLALW